MSKLKDSGKPTRMEEDKQPQPKLIMVGTSKLLSHNSTSSISKQLSHHSTHNSSNPSHQANNVNRRSPGTQLARPITQKDKIKTMPNTAKHHTNNNRISTKRHKDNSSPLFSQEQEKKG